MKLRSRFAYRARARRRPPFYRPELLRLENRNLPGFLAPLAYDAGADPVSVAVADFNGDGKPDLAVANQGNYPYPNSSVSILLGQGGGTFLPAVSYAAGNNPQSVAVGDFNGDGKQDLAVANVGDYYGNGQGVSILLGQGDGTFQTPVSYAAENNPQSVAVGDFNGDGKQDLAVANAYPGNSVSVLLGKGDGTFLPGQTFPAGGNPRYVAVGDFNGDGILDLAVANYQSANVSVLLGKGDGTFQAAVSYPAGSYPYSVAVGDFNGDGIPDLAVTNGTSNGSVSVLLGKGDGTFHAAVGYAAGYDPSSVAVGDFNGDGIPDLAVANWLSNNVSVLLGKGDGTFLPAQTFPAGTHPWSMAVGDFNGDGKPDLAVANQGTFPAFFDGSLSVLLGKGDGTFPAAPNFPAGSYPVSVAVGDFNGDGTPDLAVANEGSNNVSVLLGKGDGTFQPAQSFPAGAGPRSVAVGDFNGDGLLDLAVAGFGYDTYYHSSYDETVRVLLGQGDGTFLPAQSYAAWSDPWSVAVGDFNGDGKLDLAVANSASYGGTPSVSVLRGQGDGTFLPAVNYSAGPYPYSVAVGDFNGDGKLDLAVANRGTYPSYNDGSVSVLLGKGDGSFLPAQAVPAGGGPISLAMGDFNSDGKLDLAVANLGTPPFYTNGSVSVLLGKGDGSFQAPVSYAAGIHPTSVAVGDFNGDGKPDLAVVFSGGVRVLLGQGDGTFQTTNVSYLAGSDPISVAVGDLNGDGFPDLAVANSYSNDVSILLNDATWAGGPGRARGGPSHPLVPHPLPPLAVLPPPAGEGPPWAGSALLTLAPPPRNGPVIESPGPLALPLAEPPPQAILPVLLGEGSPPALVASRAAFDHLFVELAGDGVWDGRTDDGMPLLA
jgi:hypothetical protein